MGMHRACAGIHKKSVEQGSPLRRLPAAQYFLSLEGFSVFGGVAGVAFFLAPDALFGAPSAPPLAAEPLEASVLGFCSWLIDGVLGDGVLGVCSFFSCATAPNDRTAAATATAIERN